MDIKFSLVLVQNCFKISINIMNPTFIKTKVKNILEVRGFMFNKNYDMALIIALNSSYPSVAAKLISFNFTFETTGFCFF